MKILFSLLSILFLGMSMGAFAGELPVVRRISKAPIDRHGVMSNASVWQRNADRLTGFVFSRTVTVEYSSSRAQMLFDEKNLYLFLRADFNPKFRSDRNLKRSIFRDNNFEIFLQKEAAPNYYHIAISEKGLIYTGLNRAAGKIPGIRTHVSSTKNCWMAWLTIPLKSIGLEPKDQKIRFNICRSNIDMPNGYNQMSSFTVMSGSPNYHVPDLWPVARMSSKAEKPKVHYPSSNKYRINMMPDPGFDFVTTQFKNPDIQRKETQILSRIWVIQATGKAYNFITLTPRIPMVPGKEYTFRIRARRVGSEGSLGCLQLLRLGKKRYGAGPRPFWGIALEKEFQDYYIPFKFNSKNFHTFVFYRLGTKGNDTGVELENVSLYEGKISPLEIRRPSRAGVKNIIPGTEIKFAPNTYGKMARPPRVLVIGRKLLALPDAWEIFSGLGADVDYLVVSGKNSDTYYTVGDPKKVLSRLEKGEYDLYMIGGGGSIGDCFGVKFVQQIYKNVQKGAGLFWNVYGTQGHFAKLFKDSALKNVGKDHLLKQALPVELFHKPAPLNKNWSNDPLAFFQEGKYGKGKVIVGRTFWGHWSANFMFQMIPDFASYAVEKFPWSEFNRAYLARVVNYASGKMKERFSSAEVKGNKAVIRGENMNDGTPLVWKLTNSIGSAVSGKAVIRKGKAVVDLPKLSMSGNWVLSARALTEDGKTLDYFAKTFTRPGARILSLKDRKLYHQKQDKGEVAFTIDKAAPGMRLSWTLEDFSGRILTSGSAAAQKSGVLQIPLEPLFTNQGIVEVKLSSGKQVLDVKRIALIAQDRDRNRLLDDFTVATWNHEPMALDFARSTDQQLEKIGIRAYLLSFFYAASLNSGMGTGYGWINAGVFHAFNQKKSHIRKPRFNTPGAGKFLFRTAKKKVEGIRQLGVLHAIVCDESGLTSMTDSSEVDEHPANIAEYRKRMKAKYNTIGNFNSRMKTSYTSFDQLRPGRLADARKSGKYGEFMEWRNFNVDRWCEALKHTADGTRAGDPNVKFSGGNTFGPSPLSSTDYWKLTTKTGTDFSHEYTAMVYQEENPINNYDEFFRSFRPDMRLWGYTGYFFDRAKSFFQPWWYALHRYGGFTWYGVYNNLKSGGGYYHLLDYTGAYTRDAANLAESIKESRLQEGIGKIFLAYEWRKNDVAIYYSHDSLMVAFLQGKETRNREILAGSPFARVLYSRQGISWMLEELLYQYDFMAPEQIINGLLKDRKILFIPGVISMSEKEIKAVKAFIAKGGKVVADFMPGMYDEVGSKRKAAPFAPGEITILGASFDNKSVPQKNKVLAALNKAGSRPLIAVKDAAKVQGREAMHFIHGKMNVFAVLRDQTKGRDSLTQTFTFPVKGHLYDIRAGKYLGFGNKVTSAVPNGNAKIWGVYPYKVNSIRIKAQDTIKGGRDFVADLKVIPSNGTAGRHILHGELIPPSGKARFFLKRNLTADRGEAVFKLRIAENDPDGVWTFRVTDAMTGITAEKKLQKN